MGLNGGTGIDFGCHLHVVFGAVRKLLACCGSSMFVVDLLHHYYSAFIDYRMNLIIEREVQNKSTVLLKQFLKY